MIFGYTIHNIHDLFSSQYQITKYLIQNLSPAVTGILLRIKKWIMNDNELEIERERYFLHGEELTIYVMVPWA